MASGGADVTRPYSGGSFSASNSGRFAYTQAERSAPPALATGTSLRDVIHPDRAQRHSARRNEL